MGFSLKLHLAYLEIRGKNRAPAGRAPAAMDRWQTELLVLSFTLCISLLQRLNIISANYGRTASDVCVAQRPDELCFAEGSLDIVRNM